LKRREQELHQGPPGTENAENLRRLCYIAHEIEHELRQHRNDNADGKHVQEHGREDENEGGLAPRCADFCRGFLYRLLHQRRFRPA
jgi:hypothetical protein